MEIACLPAIFGPAHVRWLAFVGRVGFTRRLLRLDDQVVMQAHIDESDADE